MDGQKHLVKARLNMCSDGLTCKGGIVDECGCPILNILATQLVCVQDASSFLCCF